MASFLTAYLPEGDISFLYYLVLRDNYIIAQLTEPNETTKNKEIG